MDAGLGYLKPKVNADTFDKYSPPHRSSHPRRRGTIEALDLQTPRTTKSSHSHRHPGTSLEHIGNKKIPRGSLDGINSTNISLLLPILSKAKSDTTVNKSQGAREWLQTVNVEKTMAYIDNSYERAQGTKQQDGVQKSTHLLQRKISTQLKMDHAEREMKLRLKKSDSGGKYKTGPPDKAKRASLDMSRTLEREIFRLKEELKQIDDDLKTEEVKKNGTSKEMIIKRAKAIQVVQLLEAASRDLPEHGPESPEESSASNLPRITVKSPDAVHKSVDPFSTVTGNKKVKESSRLRGPFDMLTKQKPPTAPDHNGSSGVEKNNSSVVNHLRRSKSRLKSLATAIDPRRNVRGFTSASNTSRIAATNKTGVEVRQSPQTTSRVRSASVSSMPIQPQLVRHSSSVWNLSFNGLGKTEMTSSGNTSEEEGEIRTEISAETWNEINAFEKLIGEHMRLHRNSGEVH